MELPPPALVRLLSIAEAATGLNISKTTLRKIIRAGRLPIVRVGGSIRVSAATLEAFVRLNTENTPWQEEILRVSRTH